MRDRRALCYAISMALAVLLLAGCDIPTATPTPAVGAVEVDAGGFSFRPIVGFGVEVGENQATMVSRDQKTRFVLEGRLSCEVKPLEDAMGAFVRFYSRGTKEYEAHSISIAGREGLAVDVTGEFHEYRPGEKPTYVPRSIIGRVVLVAPTESQYFFAFASVVDGAGGDQWGAEEEEAFDQVMRSITFFEPAATLNPFPCFVNHETPDLAGDPGAFIDAGCTFDGHKAGTCRDDSPLTKLGCDWIDGPFGGLVPPHPIVRCSSFDANHLGFHQDSGDGWIDFGYVAYHDGQYLLVETEDEFREMFAPVETGDEALSYALAVMAGRGEANTPDAYYGLELDPGVQYSVDIVEDTHVETVAEGYLVHLYQHEVFLCDHPAFHAIDVLVTSEGTVRQIGSEVVYEVPGMECLW